MKMRAKVGGIYQGQYRNAGEVFEYDASSAGPLALASPAIEPMEPYPETVELPTPKATAGPKQQLKPVSGQ